MPAPTSPTAGVVATGTLALAVALAGCSTSNPMPTGTPTPTAIGMLGGSAQAELYSSPLSVPLSVHVTDQYGNSLPGATVTFAASGGATVAASTATTDTAGNAQISATLGAHAGVDTILASISGNPVPVMFLETALPGPAATMTIISGEDQAGTTGLPLAEPLVVQVVDQVGNAVVGDTVTWAASTGTLSAPVSVTAAGGSAEITFTPALGANAVTAMVNGTTLSALFSETGN